MLAPTRSRPRSSTAVASVRPPGEFESLLAAARIEALALLRSLMHAPVTSAAETRERRLAATAILRIPAPDLVEAPPDRAAAQPAPEPAAAHPAPQEPAAVITRAQPPVKQAPPAKPTTAAPLLPRPARPQVARILATAGADSS